MPPTLGRLARTACAASLLAALAAGAQENPLARLAAPPGSMVRGHWNGVDIERRSNCASEQNNGTHGTYAQFDIATDAAGRFTIAQTGITGLNCTYLGRSRQLDNRLAVQGTYTCTDGKQGNFQTRAIDVSAVSLAIQMDIQLTGTEACTIEAILNMARFPPP